MILIFSSSTNVYLGGVEIFNEEFEILLENYDIEFYRVPSYTNKKIIDYGYRILMSIIFVLKNYNKINFIIVQYGNFLDVLALPFLKLSFKSIRVIAHIGVSWKHINNEITKIITNCFLNIFITKVYIITEEQRKFLSHKNITKIHTIINKRFIEKEKLKNCNEKYLLFLGRVCKEKGIEDLIVVYSELNKTMNLPMLKIVGPIEETYKRQLHNLLDIYKIQNRVLILNPVYNIDDKIELIDHAFIVVYPSHKDAFPLTIIETFSRGICILATAISETKNFIEFDEFLFESGDRIDLKNKLSNLIFHNDAFENQINFMQKKSMKYARGSIVKEIIE